MAALATNLVEFSDQANFRTYIVVGVHTVGKPAMFLQKRKQAPNQTGTAEDNIQVVYGVEDLDGVVLPTRSNFAVNVRRPANADPAELAAPLAAFRDLVNSDEFGALVTSQAYLK